MDDSLQYILNDDKQDILPHYVYLMYFRLNQLKHGKEEEGEGQCTPQGEEEDKTELSPNSPPEGEPGAPPAPLDDRDRNNFCQN